MDIDRDTSPADAPRPRRRRWNLAMIWMLAGFGLVTQSGCMSALTATTLREALRETAASLSTPHDLDHASVAKNDPPPDGPDEDGIADDGSDAARPAADLERVIDNAVARLSAAGGIDAPTQELLIQTLERTPPEDWAVVVNEFAASLEEARGTGDRSADPDDSPLPAAPVGGLIAPAVSVSPRPVAPSVATSSPAPTSPPTPAQASPALLDVAEVPLQPLATADAAAAPIPAVATEPVVVAAALIEPAPALPAAAPVAEVVVAAAPEASPPMPPLPEAFDPPASIDAPGHRDTGPVVANACFATRVRGWGNVERFPAAAFRPGQEVIVYFELDRLAIRSSDAGHTTGIDCAFRLLDAAGDRVGQWSFDPIVETCPAPRRDYFARYFIQIPADAKPGRHRLEWAVRDTLAGASREAHLDFDVLPRD